MARRRKVRVLRIREKIVSEGEWQILKPMRSQSKVRTKNVRKT